MGQLMTALGQSPLTRYRGKLVIVTLTVLCMEMSLFALLTVLSGQIGLTVTDSYWSTLPPALVVVACSTPAISAVQLTLSTYFDKQGIGLGAAAIGGLIAESLPYASSRSSHGCCPGASFRPPPPLTQSPPSSPCGKAAT